jgi:hypothetical protein
MMVLTAEARRARDAGYQARWREKRNALAKRAEALERTRGRRGRRARPTDDANAFIRELYDFLMDYGARLWAWRVLKKFSSEDRAELIHAMQTVANDLVLLAQEFDG